MRSANDLLKAAGMCCEMTIAGASGGIAASTSRIASVPPVDAPIANLQAACLPSPSLVRMKLFPLDHRLILRKAGALDHDDRTAVITSVRSLFAACL